MSLFHTMSVEANRRGMSSSCVSRQRFLQAQRRLGSSPQNFGQDEDSGLTSGTMTKALADLISQGQRCHMQRLRSIGPINFP